MTYKVILSDSAYKDLENIKAYIAGDNPVAAKQYVGKILDKLSSLSEFPNRGSAIANSLFDYAKARCLICLNHAAIYQTNERARCVYVLRVLSHFQNWRNIVNKELLTQIETIAEGERVRLVKMNPSMAYDVYRNSLDEDNQKYVPDEVFSSIEEAGDVVTQIIKDYESKDGPFVYAVLRNEDQANLGYVQAIRKEDGWEIGYHIAKMFTGHGYATEVVTLFFSFLKEKKGLKELYGIVLATNKASRRVLEKCGFAIVYEGEGNYQGKRRKILRAIKHF